jgi:hypothetical protein
MQQCRRKKVDFDPDISAALPSIGVADANDAAHEPYTLAVHVPRECLCTGTLAALGSTTQVDPWFRAEPARAKEDWTSSALYGVLTQLHQFSQPTRGCRFFLRDQILRRRCVANLAELYGVIQYIAVPGWFLQRLALEARIVETRVINALNR